MTRRREEREREREAMAEELEAIQRERAAAEAVELEAKEEVVSMAWRGAGGGGGGGGGGRVGQWTGQGTGKLSREPWSSGVGSGLGAAGSGDVWLGCGAFEAQKHSALACARHTTEGQGPDCRLPPPPPPHHHPPTPPPTHPALQFHLEQAQVRSRQRLGEGRPKPIDLLAALLYPVPGFDPGSADPLATLAALGLRELRELQDDIREYRVRRTAWGAGAYRLGERAACSGREAGLQQCPPAVPALKRGPLHPR